MFSVALDEQMTSVRPLHRLLYSRSNANVYFRLQNRFNGGCFHPLLERGVGTDPAPHILCRCTGSVYLLALPALYAQ